MGQRTLLRVTSEHNLNSFRDGSAPSRYCSRISHGFKESELILAWPLSGQFNFHIERFAVRAVASDVAVAVCTNRNGAAVFCIEVSHSVVYCVAAALTQGYNDLVLQ